MLSPTTMTIAPYHHQQSWNRQHAVFLALVCLSHLLSSSEAFLPHLGLAFPSTRTPSSLVFAGFGGGGGSKSKSKKNKKRKGNKKRSGPPATNNLFTPEGRMAHIQSSIQKADFSSLVKLSLTQQAEADGGQFVLDIDPNALCVVDNFLGPDLVKAMRQEAESLVPSMVPSVSTRWDEETQTVVPYEKVGVLSTQIEGGAQGYEKSPRLVEYIVTLTAHLSHRLNGMLPESHHLSGDQQTNKLAVCLGDGSMYDKHIDNLGGGERQQGDQRKLTALYYLQPPGSHDDSPLRFPDESEVDDPNGGYFRAYDVPEEGQVTSIAPRGDRLMLFWSDSLVHDVSPSFAPNGEADRRWALTIWFVVGESGKIRAANAEVEERHFGTG